MRHFVNLRFAHAETLVQMQLKFGPSKTFLIKGTKYKDQGPAL
jgi:hypothetical protein